MPFYPASTLGTICDARLPDTDQATVMVAVPVSALSWPVREGSGTDNRSAMVVGAAGKITSGEPVVWLKAVAVTPAKVRRDGRVQAQGRPCDHARLGAAEVELDAACGPDTIERVAAGVHLTGKITAKARREMSIAFTIRATILMTLMPDADAVQVMTTLLGDLLAVPWQREHQVASGTVLSRWRTAIGAEPLQELTRRWQAAAGHTDRPAGIDVGARLQVGAIDATVTRMPDTTANRRRYGTAGPTGSGYPQIRSLHANDAFTRAGQAVLTGPAGGDKAEAEQTLLDRMLIEYADAGVFTENRLWIMDRNFPGIPRIARMTAQTHVLIRVKSDIRLTRIGDYLPDGSWPARVTGGAMSLTMRVIEYHVTLDAAITPELFCLITDLHDHQTHPAHLLAAAYRWRWDGTETALREAKSTISGAGPGTGAILRSGTPNLIDQEHAAWTIATELVRATLRSAATLAAPFAKGPRAGQNVQPQHLSFTTARRTVLATVQTGTATASLPGPTTAAAHQRALHQIAKARITTDRNRHRPRKIKSSQPFGHTPAGTTTRTIPAQIHVYGTPTT